MTDSATSTQMPQTLPRHIAVIMDGNGRWAKARGLPRTLGHKQGAEAVRRVVEAVAQAKVPFLTLYGFSTENWTRPKDEISELMKLLRVYLRSEAAELHKNNVKLKVIGFRHRLSDDIVEMIENVERLTENNTAITVTIALDYGGRQDIVEAARNLAAAGTDITEQSMSAALMTGGMPEVDLMVRSSGELRISNFLLWQSAYAEFVFMDTLWPDFGKSEIDAALAEFSKRQRRFGGVAKQELVG